MLRHPRLERAVGLVFEDTERGQVRGGPVPLIEACQIKALMLSERVICDDLRTV